MDACKWELLLRLPGHFLAKQGFFVDLILYIKKKILLMGPFQRWMFLMILDRVSL